ncbi:MAG: 1-deoxy-D-xylulose-5-phosphate reductoisomerase, partial [Selenomonadaceae bacterium]|nr:1-deoxy-D-xylulose-5-phosphate reductoisomerase [Selenomonadaceae bacterium]
QIQVVVHPQSIVHSMVEFVDGSVIAQLASTDMRLPIQYALTFPARSDSTVARLDFWSMRALTFEPPDLDTFRGLKLAYEVGKRGGTAPCVFNAANEIAVNAFLNGRIKFLDIYRVIETVLDRRAVIDRPALEEIISENNAARADAEHAIAAL